MVKDSKEWSRIPRFRCGQGFQGVLPLQGVLSPQDSSVVNESKEFFPPKQKILDETLKLDALFEIFHIAGPSQLVLSILNTHIATFCCCCCCFVVFIDLIYDFYVPLNSVSSSQQCACLLRKRCFPIATFFLVCKYFSILALIYKVILSNFSHY